MSAHSHTDRAQVLEALATTAIKDRNLYAVELFKAETLKVAAIPNSPRPDGERYPHFHALLTTLTTYGADVA